MKTTFCIISFFDPYGDRKSTRKIFKRRFFHTEKSKEEVIEKYASLTSEHADYYGGVNLKFAPYKRTKEWRGYSEK